MQIPFVGASYQERSTNLDCQACINLYPVMGESGTAKAPRALYGTPGLRILVNAVTGTVRGMHPPTDGGPAIVVVGGAVYRMDSSFNLTNIGILDDLQTPVKIDDNGLQAVIVTGPSGYIVDLATNVITPILDEAFYGADNVDFLNTYAVFNKPGTNVFYVSGANEITFDALDFATCESNFEPIVNFIINHGEILFFKKTVTEIWRPSGNADFPFARDTNASIEIGCAARDSIASMDNTVFWLGQNTEGGGIIYRMNGYTPVRVSTDAIESGIAKYSTTADAVAYSYQQEGHTFYVISFPTGRATWVYDVNTNLWHQRAYLNPASGTLNRHRSNTHIFFAGKNVVGDYENGSIYEFDLDYYLDGVDPMPAIRSSGHIFTPDYTWVLHNRIRVDVETGVGTSTGPGSAPITLLQWSDDGGHTWSNQHAGDMGKIGAYKTRLRWDRMGRSRDRVYRLTITDPVKRVILGATINSKE